LKTGPGTSHGSTSDRVVSETGRTVEKL
jgi:hypothetical protein